MTDNERDNTLMRIHADVAAIREKVEGDHRVLHGNGQPGLVERVTRVEDAQKHGGRVWYLLGWLVNAGLALAAFLRRVGGDG